MIPGPLGGKEMRTTTTEEIMEQYPVGTVIINEVEDRTQIVSYSPLQRSVAIKWLSSEPFSYPAGYEQDIDIDQMFTMLEATVWNVEDESATMQEAYASLNCLKCEDTGWITDHDTNAHDICECAAGEREATAELVKEITELLAPAAKTSSTRWEFAANGMRREPRSIYRHVKDDLREIVEQAVMQAASRVS
jgi:hypothetical protein